MVSQLTDLIERYFISQGFPTEMANQAVILLLLFSIFISLISIIYKIIKAFFIFRNRRILNRDLHPFFTKTDIYNYTKNYIPQKFQNVTPSEDDEPGRQYIASAKNKLMPLFLNKVLKGTGDEKKYYLLLADTGMGKTAFLLNLYIRYKNQLHFFWQKPKLSIRIFPLGFKNVESEIEKVIERNNTIIILDAFDEDIEAIKDYKKRLGQLIDVIKDFRIIIITCRSQFFPSNKEEPHEAGHFTYGEQGQYKFQKLYLSVFDKKDILSYLFKKFKLHPIKFFKAYKIVSKSPNLMIRPMLLSYIGDLADTKTNYKYAFNIYEQLIAKWIARESQKPAMVSRYQNYGGYAEHLYQFSKNFAKNLYINRELRGGYWIHYTEKIGKVHEVQLSDFETPGFDMSDEDKKSRSLLNRNSEGNYKFSHKSILEYFLAKIMTEDLNFLNDFNFIGMDAAKSFYDEMVVEFLNKKIGFYKTIDDNKTMSLSQMTIKTKKEVTAIIIQNGGTEYNINLIAGLKEIKNILIGDQCFSYPYFIQICIAFMKKNENNDSQAIQIVLKEMEAYANQIREMNNSKKILDHEILDLFTKLEYDQSIIDLVKSTLALNNPSENEKIASFRKLKSILNTGESKNVVFNNYILFARKLNNVQQFLPEVKLVY